MQSEHDSLLLCFCFLSVLINLKSSHSLRFDHFSSRYLLILCNFSIGVVVAIIEENSRLGLPLHDVERFIFVLLRCCWLIMLLVLALYRRCQILRDAFNQLKSRKRRNVRKVIYC